MITKEMLLGLLLAITSSLPCIASAQAISFYTLPNGQLVGTSQTYGNTTFVTDGAGRLTGTAITIPSYSQSPQPVSPLPVPQIQALPPMPALPLLPR